MRCACPTDSNLQSESGLSIAGIYTRYRNASASPRGRLERLHQPGRGSHRQRQGVAARAAVRAVAVLCLWSSTHPAKTNIFNTKSNMFSTKSKHFNAKSKHFQCKINMLTASMACTSASLLPGGSSFTSLQAERGLSIAGMYIHSDRREVYQSPACIYKAIAERGLSIAGMYIQSRQQEHVRAREGSVAPVR